jgi:hypothetical protein
MGVDLFSIFLTKSAEWAIGKTLDVIWKCATCSEEKEGQIGNIMHNDIFCPNCHKEVNQFTHACDFTVQPSRKIAHIGVGFDGDWNFHREWSWSDFDHVARHIEVPGWYLFDGLKRQQLVEKNELIDYDNNTPYSRDETIWTPKSHYDKRRMRLIGHFQDIPDHIWDVERLYALETRIQSRFGDVLARERYVFRT